MTQLHEDLIAAVNRYMAESDKFEEKGVKAAAVRARKALQDIGKLIKERRKEINAIKETLPPKQ